MSSADEYEREFSPRVLLAVGVVVLLLTGLVVGGGVAYLLWASPDETEPASDGCSRYRTVDLTVASEMYDVLVDVVDDVAPACTSIEPSVRSGSEVALGVATGGALPDVWIPESRIWLGRARLGEARVRVLAPSLARTPVLLVGGPRARRFATWGDAESSGLVTVPDPEVSSVGALALVAPLAEARVSGRTVAEAQQMVVPFAQTYGARRARGADEEVWPTMFRSLSPRLVVTTEQELVRAEDGRRRLRDLTPAVGAPVLDFPLAVREDAAPGAREVALGLMDHLTGEVGTAALVEHGLRPARGHSPAAARSDVSTYLPTPTARTVVTAVQSWQTLAVPSAILAVVDASGSMDFDSGTGTRMDLLADAARIGLSFLPDHARVGLWIFSIDKGGPGQDWRVMEPIRRLDDLRFGRTQRYALRERAAELPSLTDGGTGLYDTALAAYREAVRSHRRNYSNAVVLMTDGRNDDPASIGLEQLLARLRELRDPDRPVRIVGIAISEDADLAALQEMARVTGGDAYLAAQPEDILGVFARAVLSR